EGCAIRPRRRSWEPARQCRSTSRRRRPHPHQRPRRLRLGTPPNQHRLLSRARRSSPPPASPCSPRAPVHRRNNRGPRSALRAPPPGAGPAIATGGGPPGGSPPGRSRNRPVLAGLGVAVLIAAVVAVVIVVSSGGSSKPTGKPFFANGQPVPTNRVNGAGTA